MTYVVLLILALVTAAPAHAQSEDYPNCGTIWSRSPEPDETTLAAYADLDGTTCTGFTENRFLQGSIWLNLAGAAAGGITGAEFGLYPWYCDSDMQIFITPDPGAAFVVGDALANGLNVAYAACQTGPRVRLATFLYIANTDDYSCGLLIGRDRTPSSDIFCCPLVTLCDGPVYTKVCVENGAPPTRRRYAPDPSGFWLSVNTTGDWAGQCPPLPNRSPTAVTDRSWSGLKSLYN